MKRILLGIAGALLVLVGLAGLVLPLLPGWALIFLGLSLLSPGFAARLKKRFYRFVSRREIVRLPSRRLGGAAAGFTTRHLPLVVKNGGELLQEQRADALRGFLEPHFASGEVPRAFAVPGQVHGSRVAVLEEGPAADGGILHCPETDGLITRIRGLALLAVTADCLPIFMAAGRGRAEWAGLVHAGWRGTQDRIAERALLEISRRAGVLPAEVRIAFGPRIGPNHYEVGPEFLSHFPRAARRFPQTLRSRRGRYYFDLAGENRAQLLGAGASARQILDVGICTVRANGHYYSYRREGEAAGRMISWIALP